MMEDRPERGGDPLWSALLWMEEGGGCFGIETLPPPHTLAPETIQLHLLMLHLLMQMLLMYQ